MSKEESSSLQEVLEGNEALSGAYKKAENFFEANQNLVYGVGIGIAVLIIGFFGGRWYLQSQNEEAQSTMFQAIYYFEADSLKKSLNGDGNNPGFIEIIDNYPLTDASNLAKFYAGAANLKLGNFDDAILYLDGFSASDFLIQARAFSLTGDAYMEKGEFEDAVNYYEKASKNNSNKDFTPTYLMKLALAQELLNDFESANKTYDRIINEFQDGAQTNDAKKFKAALSSKIVQE